MREKNEGEIARLSYPRCSRSTTTQENGNPKTLRCRIEALPELDALDKHGVSLAFDTHHRAALPSSLARNHLNLFAGGFMRRGMYVKAECVAGEATHARASTKTSGKTDESSSL